LIVLLRSRIRLDRLPEKRVTLREGMPAQILARSGAGVEGKEHDSVRRCVDGRTESVEVRKPILVLDHHLTIEHRGLAGQLATRIDNPAISWRPVFAVARDSADLAAVDEDEGALAVVLDLVNPALSGG
jgi:hypothetical protein